MYLGETYVFATKEVGVIGNLALIWYTIAYLTSIYIGSISLAFLRVEPTAIMKDVGITQLHGEKAATSQKNEVNGQFDVPEVLKVPATILMLCIFCIIYRYRKDMAANRKFFSTTNIKLLVIFDLYKGLQGTRIIALILMFINAC